VKKLSKLTEFRKQKDQYFLLDEHSPLTQEQKAEFKGLKYFPENPELLFELHIDEFPEKETIQMQTSTGDIQTYKRFGKIRFHIDGEKVELTIFASQHGFFLPFVDSQAGNETYGAGRYLDPYLLPGGKLLVDFNHAYNPYCAYNDLYSCPLPPAENRLNVAMKAGEMNFK
jgi:uncharacterized protein (DUF1684 family)